MKAACQWLLMIVVMGFLSVVLRSSCLPCHVVFRYGSSSCTSCSACSLLLLLLSPLLPAVDHLHGHRLPMAKNTDKWRAKYANYFAVHCRKRAATTMQQQQQQQLQRPLGKMCQCRVVSCLSLVCRGYRVCRSAASAMNE